MDPYTCEFISTANRCMEHADQCMFRWLSQACSHFGMMQYIATHTVTSPHTRIHTHTLMVTALNTLFKLAGFLCSNSPPRCLKPMDEHAATQVSHFRFNISPTFFLSLHFEFSRVVWKQSQPRPSLSQAMLPAHVSRPLVLHVSPCFTHKSLILRADLAMAEEDRSPTSPVANLEVV